MKKQVLAALTGAALTASFASEAAITVYGKLNLGVASVDNGADSTLGVTDDASRIGIKGEEDLGNGLFAIYQIELPVDADEGGITSPSVTGTSATKATNSRNIFAGLKGGFGTVRLGYIDTAYKSVNGPIDALFGDTVGDFTHSVYTGETRAANTISYISPSFTGVTFAFDSIRGETGDTPTDEINQSTANIIYSNGPLWIGASIYNWEESTATFNNLLDLSGNGAFDAGDNITVLLDKSTKIAVKYDIGAFSILALSEKATGDVTVGAGFVGDDVDAKTTVLGVSYKFGDSTVAVQQADYKAVGEDLAKQTSLGWFYALSKTSILKFVYTTISNEDGVGVAGRTTSNGSINLPNPLPGEKVTATQAQMSWSF